jgi:hypothetical protein
MTAARTNIALLYNFVKNFIFCPNMYVNSDRKKSEKLLFAIELFSFIL